MKSEIAILRATRNNYLKALDGISLAHLNEIPQDYNNNLIWNAAHAVVTQQLLCYGKSNLELKLPKTIIELYRKGSKPESDISQAAAIQIKGWLTESVDWMEEDLKAGLFITFNEYPTSYGFLLTSIEDAIAFNNVHEGMHLGYIIALKKHLKL